MERRCALSLISLLLLSLALTACHGGPEIPLATAQDEQGAVSASITPLPASSATPTVQPTEIPPPTATPVVILPPEPVEVEFRAADGEVLKGTYFPGGENPSPIIVLMPWARGDQGDWEPIARWLQGRGELIREPDYNHAWKSSSWYPERELDFPLGVFTFSFRSCQGGCQAYRPAEWLMDAQAAVETAVGLPGVDQGQILTAGASIGADAALDGCVWLNQNGAGICRGSFALSPGSFLTKSFPGQAGQLWLMVPDAPIYCLYGLRDDASVETCEGKADLLAVNFGYTEAHGMELIKPDQNPDPLGLLLEFIQDAVEEAP